MERDGNLYYTEPALMFGRRNVLVEYLQEERQAAHGRARRLFVPYDYDQGSFDLLAVVCEGENALFTVRQALSRVLLPGISPRERGWDTALRAEVDRRIRTGDWEEDGDYVLPPLA